MTAEARPPTPAESLLDPYLADEPPDGWHLIDNADADTVREALEAAIVRLRAGLGVCDSINREHGRQAGGVGTDMLGWHREVVGWGARLRAALTGAE